jgi:hypothetical protein
LSTSSCTGRVHDGGDGHRVTHDLARVPRERDDAPLRSVMSGPRRLQVEPDAVDALAARAQLRDLLHRREVVGGRRQRGEEPRHDRDAVLVRALAAAPAARRGR